MKKDTRYQQRFENFEKSFLLLQESLHITNPSIVEKAGSIQFFEISFELSWKLMKDYSQHLGYDDNSPRAAIKRFFSLGYIDNGDKWLDALMDRNLTTHTYDEEMATKVYLHIKNDYFPLLKALFLIFKDKLCLA